MLSMFPRFALVMSTYFIVLAKVFRPSSILGLRRFRSSNTKRRFGDIDGIVDRQTVSAACMAAHR